MIHPNSSIQYYCQRNRRGNRTDMRAARDIFKEPIVTGDKVKGKPNLKMDD
jgi:hypothetical protein